MHRSENYGHGIIFEFRNCWEDGRTSRGRAEGDSFPNTDDRRYCIYYIVLKTTLISHIINIYFLMNKSTRLVYKLDTI